MSSSEKYILIIILNRTIEMPWIKPHLRNLDRTHLMGRIDREDLLLLDINEGSGLPVPFIRKVLCEINPRLIATYPEYEVLSNKIALHNNLKPQNICLSNGSDAAIKYIFDAYISPGDKIVFAEPTFAMYPIYCKMFNAQKKAVGYNSDLSFPLKKFIAELRPGIKIAIIVNPNSPTGCALKEEDLLLIIKKASMRNILVVVDEAYFYFYRQSVIEYVNKFKNLIVLRTFSKLCSMASLRLGYAASCPQIVADLMKVRPTYDVNGLAVLFVEKLLDNSYLINKLLDVSYAEKKYLMQRLFRSGIEYREGSANFVLINCGRRADEIRQRLKGSRILVGGGFKQEFLKDYIRVTIGNAAAMRRFWRSFIKAWRG